MGQLLSVALTYSILAYSTIFKMKETQCRNFGYMVIALTGRVIELLLEAPRVLNTAH